MSLKGFSGASGLSYGLNVRGAGVAKPPSALRPTLAALAPLSDDEGDGDDAVANTNAALARAAKRAAESKAAERLHAAALAQDASVFDYDGVYDDMKQAAKPAAAAAAAQPSSRYIGQLLVKAREREREADVVFERRTVKERSKEDHLFGDKEKFVTAAYKAKLAADAAWTAEEAAREKAAAAREVGGKRDMSAFYANLLTKNEAFGGGEAAAAAAGGVSASAAATAWGAAAPPPYSAPAAACAAVPVEAAAPAVAGLGDEETDDPEAALPARVEPRPAPPAGPAAAAAAAAAAEEVRAAILPPPKRERAAEEVVLSARERYLARKKERTQ